MKGFLIALLLTCAVLGYFVWLAGVLNEDERKLNKSSQEWLLYSEQHHCKIVHDESFSNPTALWECDGGYQVKR